MKETDLDFVVVFRTGQLYELDMVAEALTQNEIPYFRQQEMVSGLRLAMPASPATGPGVWWSILVTRQCENAARVVLETLPIQEKTEPDVWDFAPSENVKFGWKLYAIISILIPIVIYIIDFLKN